MSLGGSATSKLDLCTVGRRQITVTATVKVVIGGIGVDAPQTLQKGDTIIVTIKNYKAPIVPDIATQAIEGGRYDTGPNNGRTPRSRDSLGVRQLGKPSVLGGQPTNNRGWKTRL